MAVSSISEIALELGESPLRSVLFLGAGSSISSGAPTASSLSEALVKEFFPYDPPRLLVDACNRIELVHGRASLVHKIREILYKVSPSGAILQLPEFNFSRIFTTNFDLLVDKSFENKSIPLPVIRSNKDFAFDDRQYNAILFKIHGCITEDRVDGSPQGMILTEDDYSLYSKYRAICMQHLDTSLTTSNVIFVGYSLSDENIKRHIDRASEFTSKQEAPGKVYLIQYEKDEIAAALWQRRGMKVAFGDLDDLLNAMIAVKTNTKTAKILNPYTIEPRHQIARHLAAYDITDLYNKEHSIQAMLTGSPATYADIRQGNTFTRSILPQVVHGFLNRNKSAIFVLTGSGGCGKTTCARNALHEMNAKFGFKCFEHKSHLPIDIDTWKGVEQDLFNAGLSGVVLFDEMNNYQYAINNIAQHLIDLGTGALSIIICAHPSIWRYRTKSPALSKSAKIIRLSTLDKHEIDSIMELAYGNVEISRFLDKSIRGRDKSDIRKLLFSKSRNDLFVCFKYLFDNRSMDEIVLKEFSELQKVKITSLDDEISISEIYKLVCFLEATGKHVHRQMVLRLSNFDLSAVHEILDALTDVVNEEERDFVEGIYLWRTRHQRIAKIIAESKFTSLDREANLKTIIMNLNPAIESERQFGNALCNTEIGIDSIRNGSQTAMYRLLVDAMPFERVPRHRYIRNLLKEKEFGIAELAIDDARKNRLDDSVISRYDIDLDIAKAKHQSFLEDVDRQNILEAACDKGIRAISKRPNDMYNYETYCKAALSLYNYSGRHERMEDALAQLKMGYQKIGDEIMTEWIGKFTSEMARIGHRLSRR